MLTGQSAFYKCFIYVTHYGSVSQSAKRYLGKLQFNQQAATFKTAMGTIIQWVRTS